MEIIDLAMQKAAVLTEALPYIQDFSGSTVLVKVGGSVMENVCFRKDAPSSVAYSYRDSGMD